MSMKPTPTWQLAPEVEPPDWFVYELTRLTPRLSQWDGLAKLLWQRGIQNRDTLARFLSPQQYTPTSPFEFGEEMQQAVARLNQARIEGEKVTIWGDFDADGVTSTAVLLDGLGQFFPASQLDYYIPNRLTESHGLNVAGIERLAEQGTQLIVTCDTGSTNLAEVELGQRLGIDTIITDHHTLPALRPPVAAIINPRYLAEDHPLFHLSGVAVAYKLVEALYQQFPDIPQASLDELLDLVAIGLIADLVQLTGDCRYLAQRGIECLQRDYQRSPEARRRPGIGRLLDLCRKTGDRPTDISFGIGPRINAVSRIYGDASFCVQLLTNLDLKRCHRLAESAELANTRRKEIQQSVVQDAILEVAQLDLSTTQAIVLHKPEWPVGVLGLVASQIAQEYHKPTLLLSSELGSKFAQGSARSVAQIDLYQLVNSQAHLLHRFGGHPFAAGLSLPLENLALFTEGINQELNRTLASGDRAPILHIDLELTVADLGKELFQELKYLEPCGMGNPVPRILVRNCQFTQVYNANIKDNKGNKVKYIKTHFVLTDSSSKEGIPGLWWGHYQDDIPSGQSHVVVELDFNDYQKYHVRIIDLVPVQQEQLSTPNPELKPILDWRTQQLDEPEKIAESDPWVITKNPVSWQEIEEWLEQANQQQKTVAIAYEPFTPHRPIDTWTKLVGMAKYLSRTQESISVAFLQDRLQVTATALHLGLNALSQIGFTINSQDNRLEISYNSKNAFSNSNLIYTFLSAVQEEQFRRQYFAQLSLDTLQRTTSG
ncbi:single-stranded-DNA-specific exonuclease RecJ [Roseofilum sp. BLCC_M91]|uniref:Single-stranded-DNA-specific exonuclease RecJ n=2 Tax=Roseofilum TaxID=1233426 RepID=A0ABT7BDW2_9CYAN|nr:single-stranded-DNA-specific exonuclease RecJ [Roseofilum halophilum BLCC-M91]